MLNALKKPVSLKLFDKISKQEITQHYISPQRKTYQQLNVLWGNCLTKALYQNVPNITSEKSKTHQQFWEETLQWFVTLSSNKKVSWVPFIITINTIFYLKQITMKTYLKN